VTGGKWRGKGENGKHKIELFYISGELKYFHNEKLHRGKQKKTKEEYENKQLPCSFKRF